MLPTTEPSDLEEPSPVEREAQAEFDVRLREATPRVYAAWTLLAANVIVYIAMIASGVGAVEPDAASLVAWGADYGPLTLHGQAWRIFTSTFLHAGFMHLACNMIGIFFWAPLVERLYGNGTFLLLYLFAGATGSLASLLFHPQGVSVGASGALLGLVGALASYIMLHKGSLHYAVSQRIWYSLGPVVFYSLQEGRSGEINVAAHVGGLLGGMVLGAIVARPIAANRPPLAWPRVIAASAVAVVCVAVPYEWLARRPIASTTSAASAVDEVAPLTAWFYGEAHRLEALQASLLAGPLESNGQRQEAATRLQRECLESWQSALLRLNLASVRGVGPFHPDLRIYAELRQEEVRLLMRQLRNPSASVQKEIERVRSRLKRLLLAG